jgi:hypothetical protein
MAQPTTRGRPKASTKVAGGAKRGSLRGAGGRAPKLAPGKAGSEAASKQGATAATKTSKDELRAQVTKMERANANLRAKNKELKRAASAAADRLAELEQQVSRHERRLAKEETAAGTPSRPGRKPGRRAADAQDRSDRDPGDAVPPGVAVQQPEPLSAEDRKVLDHLNEELSPD